MITVNKEDFLTEDARAIREEVFVREQGFEIEFDERDKNANHLVCYVDEEPAGVCRYFPGEKEKAYIIGRVAVRKPFRGQKIGKYMMEAAEDAVRRAGGSIICLSAQLRARFFYEGIGYECVGEPYRDEDCEHIQMIKRLVSEGE